MKYRSLMRHRLNRSLGIIRLIHKRFFLFLFLVLFLVRIIPRSPVYRERPNAQNLHARTCRPRHAAVPIHHIAYRATICSTMSEMQRSKLDYHHRAYDSASTYVLSEVRAQYIHSGPV